MEDHTLRIPSYEHQSPLSWYQTVKKQDNFIFDEAQERAIMILEQLWQDLVIYHRTSQSFWGKIILQAKAPQGVYMWGGVGRGKSFLMDAFYNCLPFQNKRRVHFHAFMAEVHNRMRELKEKKDPLVELAKEIAKETMVFCLDEFHVSDIADAMILGRLIKTMLDQKLIFVATSNYAPENLYDQGQNRYSFLSTIDLIKTCLKVINVDGGEDYRFRTLTEAGIFLIPVNEETENRMLEIFHYLAKDESLLSNSIEILGRSLLCRKRTLSSIWFDFKELCFSARSQQDFLKIAEQYQYVFISGIEKLTQYQRNEARRLTWLIDILYDYKVKLCATSNVSIQDIYPEGDFSDEFKRTVSRMMEMQSKEYLKLPHWTLR